MPVAQIFSVVTNEFGSTGPLKKLYAVGLPSKEAAADLVRTRLKPGETVTWVDARTLDLDDAEVRTI